MSLTVRHTFMVTGPDLDTCGQHVRFFLDTTQLVRYDSVEIDPEHSIRGTEPRFQQELDMVLAANQAILAELLGELQQEGCRQIDDLLTLPQGFQSKLLHTVSHLLDGFFGIDSRFFDLDEDSHRLTAKRRRQIKDAPEQCWLIGITARSAAKQGFEKKD
ncbi:MAG: hypothetical protein GXP57_05370 [Deltaproteobacteria bacterium]|nr:hypothetical protein [Deltaproteobacteria bacterium]